MAAPSLTGNKASLGQWWWVETVSNVYYYFLHSAPAVKYSLQYPLPVKCQISFLLCPQTCQEKNGALPEQFVCSVSSHIVISTGGSTHICVYLLLSHPAGSAVECFELRENNAWSQWSRRARNTMNAGVPPPKPASRCGKCWRPPTGWTRHLFFFFLHLVIRATHRKWAVGCQEAIRSQREITTWIILWY